MYALTVWQPWAWAITHAGKRIENRTWPPPRWIIDKRIAIHAGKTIDKHSLVGLAEGLGDLGIDVPGPSGFVLGAVVATATVVGWIRELKPDSPQAMWFGGPCGWILQDVLVLPEPMPYRGQRKLWSLPPDVSDSILAAVRSEAAG